MIYTKDEHAYILKHETGKYFLIQNATPLEFEYLTDDPVKATRFSIRELAESAIERNKNMDRNTMRWESEKILADIISDCTVKEIKIHIEYEVEE
jgi:hypothetical protein